MRKAPSPGTPGARPADDWRGYSNGDGAASVPAPAGGSVVALERGAGPNRTGEWRFCRPLPYHLATAPQTTKVARLRRFLNPPQVTRASVRPASTRGVPTALAPGAGRGVNEGKLEPRPAHVRSRATQSESSR